MVGVEKRVHPQDNFYRDGELAKKYLKRGEKSAKENLGTVKGRIDRAFFTRGKEFSAVKKEEQPSKKRAVMDEGGYERRKLTVRPVGRPSQLQ